MFEHEAASSANRDEISPADHSTLAHGFLTSVGAHPDRPALDIGDRLYSYQELGSLAGAISKVASESPTDQSGLAAFLAYRSLSAYAAPLGILLSGRGYVPLNPSFPADRLRSMLDQASTSILVVGKECLSEVMPLLNRDQKLTLIFPDVSKSSLAELESTFLQHLFVSSDDLEANKMIPTTCTAGPDDLAYLMFTSGSTGAPKGVPISHQNATSYVSYMMRRYRVAATDRFSQAVDQTFDLSVHDMFVCWLSGACLCPVPKEAVMAPSRFIREKNITMWLSVPSTGVFMLRMRMLRPGAFPSLRFSLFCGEPLTAAVAQAWAAASPNGVVENIYGPTEATVAITHYRWNAERSADECVNGIVPIGWMFEGQKGLLIREDGRPATTGCDGELLLAGSQVTAGYWGAAAKNNTRFITVAGDDEKHWYRTGDLVRRGENDCLYYLSRLDDQIKIRGYRVELQEIDFVLRRATGNEASVSVAWPVRAGVADGVVAFVAAEGGDIAGIRRACQDALPDYMVPSEILFIDELPLNPSGKVDRSALRKRLEEHADGAD